MLDALVAGVCAFALVSLGFLAIVLAVWLVRDMRR